MSGSATLDSQNASQSPTSAKAIAHAQTEQTAPAPVYDPETGCPRCGSLDSWGTASWCPKCGYYPRLGGAFGGEAPTETAVETHAAPTSHMEALARLPRWAYILAGGIVAIFFISLAVRVITPDNSFSRSLWSVTQLFVGGGTFIGVHVYAFIRAGMKADGLSAFDVIVHPIEVWRPTFRELPATARRVYAGMWGLTAAVCAILIIGSIRYSVLTEDWGFKERPKQNLMKKIKDQMLANAKDAEEAADNLEDAINDFAGDESKKNDKDSELEMLSAECVVVGYNVDRETGEVTELVLATIVDEKLQYAGTVSGGLPPDVQEELKSKLPKLSQEQPFVKCPVSANWVKPVVTCRTSFKSWSENKQMQQPVFKELLAETDVK